MKALILVTILTVAIWNQKTLQAQEAASLAVEAEISEAMIDDRVKALKTVSGLAEATMNELTTKYEQARDFVKLAEKHAEAEKQFVASVSAAPQEAAAAEAALKLKQATPAPSTAIPTDLESLALALSQAQAMETQLKGAHEQEAEMIKGQQARPVAIRSRLTALASEIADQEKALTQSAASKTNTESDRAQRTVTLAHRRALLREKQMLEQELASHAARLELLQANHHLAGFQLTQQQLEVAQFQAALENRRRENVARTVNEAEAVATSVADHSFLIDQAAENLSLSEELKRLSQYVDEMTPKLESLKSETSTIENDFKQAKEQLEIAGLSKELGQLLREERGRLQLPSSVSAHPSNEHDVGNLGLGRLRVERLRRALTNQSLTLNALFKASAIDETEQAILRPKAAELLASRVKVLEQLSDSYQAALRSLRDFEFAKNQRALAAKNYTAFLDRYLLWIPDIPAVGLSFPIQLADSGLKFVMGEPVRAGIREWGGLFSHAPFITYVMAALIIAILLLRTKVLNYQNYLAREVADVSRDRPGLTARALLLVALQVLPLPLFLGWLGLQFSSQPGNLGLWPAIGAAFIAAARLLFVLTFIRRLCRPQGVGESHFQWPAPSLELIYKQFRWFTPLTTVLVFIITLTEWRAYGLYRETVGRMALLIGLIALGVFFRKLTYRRGGLWSGFVQKSPQSRLARLQRLWEWLAIGIPLALGILALRGYYYASLQLVEKLSLTLILAVLAILIYHLALRAIVSTKRKVATSKQVQQVAEEKEAALRTGDNVEETLPLVNIDALSADAVDHQSKALVKTLLFLGLAIGLWWTWSSVIPAIQLLEEREAWAFVSESGGVKTSYSISWAQVLFAIVIAAATIIVTINLPGALEILLLRHLPLSTGGRYAIANIAQYTLAVIGFILVFNRLGITWGRMQWLVAALTVGLGFGLQEIFANFVCGVLLLLERPIRVGDVVTVDGVSGIVSNIRIRATTITDWDRKEFIVPNKQLVTGRVLNWTLSNAVNRVVIPVDIAYDKDPRKAREILLDIAREHPLIMTEPGPSAALEEFADSSLQLTLRCYLPDLDNRGSVIHDLRTTIIERFDKEGIAMPYPHLDVHVRK